MAIERNVIEPVAGVSNEIGFYLAEMNEVREQLREAVSDLTREQVAERAVEGAHSIGALALHIGEAEWYWIECVIGGHKLTDEDKNSQFWDVLKDPEKFGRLNFSAEDCLRVVGEIREGARAKLASLNDDDLDGKLFHMERRENKYEFSLRWILHHLVDHEAQHKGQILMLKRLLTGHTKEF